MTPTEAQAVRPSGQVVVPRARVVLLGEPEAQGEPQERAGSGQRLAELPEALAARLAPELRVPAARAQDTRE